MSRSRMGFVVPLLPAILSAACSTLPKAAETAGLPLPSPTPTIQQVGHRPEADGRVPMSAAGVACLGARVASTPALLEDEIALLAEVSCLTSQRKARVLGIQSELCGLRALELRNKSAAATLRLFYQMVETDQQLELIDQVLGETSKLLDAAHDLREVGSQPPRDEEALKRQQAETARRKTELATLRRRLDLEMALQLAGSPAAPKCIQPRADLDPAVRPVDRKRSEATALSSRADLAAIRLVLRTLDRDTLPLARGVLRQRDGALGTPLPKWAQPCKLCLQEILCDCCEALARPVHIELAIRHRQLSHVLADSEQGVSVSILLAADAVEEASRGVTSANEVYQSWQRQVQQQSDKGGSGVVKTFSVGESKLGAIRARMALVSAVVALRQAEVTLRETEATLSVECGYPAPSVCAGPAVELVVP